MKQLTLVPPSDPRVNTMLAPQNDLLLKEHGYENRQELSESLRTPISGSPCSLRF